MPPRTKSRRGRRAKTPSKKAAKTPSKKASKTGRGKSRKAVTSPTPVPEAEGIPVSSTGAEIKAAETQHQDSDEAKHYKSFLNRFLEGIESRHLSFCVCVICLTAIYLYSNTTPKTIISTSEDVQPLLQSLKNEIALLKSYDHKRLVQQEVKKMGEEIANVKNFCQEKMETSREMEKENSDAVQVAELIANENVEALKDDMTKAMNSIEKQIIAQQADNKNMWERIQLNVNKQFRRYDELVNAKIESAEKPMKNALSELETIKKKIGTKDAEISKEISDLYDSVKAATDILINGQGTESGKVSEGQSEAGPTDHLIRVEEKFSKSSKAMKKQIQSMEKVVSRFSESFQELDQRISKNKEGINERVNIISTEMKASVSDALGMYSTKIFVDETIAMALKKSEKRSGDKIVALERTVEGNLRGFATTQQLESNSARIKKHSTTATTAAIATMEKSAQKHHAKINDEFHTSNTKMFKKLKNIEKAITDLQNVVDAEVLEELHRRVMPKLKEVEKKMKASDDSRKRDLTATTHLSNSDIEKIELLVDSSIEMYHADRVGQIDFALHSAGASIVKSLTSSTHHNSLNSMLTFSLSPEIALSPDNSIGQCWPFSGSTGDIGIQLYPQNSVVPTAVTIEHIPRAIAYNIKSAPNQFEVWSYAAANDKDPVLLYTGQYDAQNGKSVQTFPFENDRVFPIVQLRILSNFGEAGYTCIYRVRVHGEQVSV